MDLRSFDIDQVCGVIASSGYQYSNDPITHGITIIRYKPGTYEKGIQNSIGINQIRFYWETSQDIQECAARCIAHAVDGIRSDLSVREMAVLNEQDAKWSQRLAEMETRFQEQHKNTVRVFTEELQRLADRFAPADSDSKTDSNAVTAPPDAAEPEIQTPDNLADPRPKELWALDLPGKGGGRARNALEHLGCKTVGDVANLRPSQILAVHLVGKQTVNIIESALKSHGLSLTPDPVYTPPAPEERHILHRPRKGPKRTRKDGYKRKHSTESVLSWAEALGIHLAPEDYDQKGRIFGHVVARLMRLYVDKFGALPTSTPPQREFATL